MNQQNIRNFCIIAHIDHGKSTLADRLLELTGTIEKRLMHEQYLDTMELEQERGITIKLQPVRMTLTLPYPAGGRGGGGEGAYILNLIDTPGHVDFTYEVSRSLAACEGAVLVVDATQGIQAQTLANLHLAKEQNLKIIPVINKIDLPNADPARVTDELCNILGFSRQEILNISAKTGQGVAELLEAVVQRIPPPSGSPEAPARALVFDSTYDKHRGVVVFVRMIDGEIATRDDIVLLGAGKTTHALEVGYFRPQFVKSGKLSCGEVGYIVTDFREVAAAKVGDTVTVRSSRQNSPHIAPLPGYKEVKPLVFASLYPVEADEYPKLREALLKLKLSDAALSFEPENVSSLGSGFRCGFLGLLHLDIIQERLSREFDLDLVVTTPTVAYKVYLRSGEARSVFSASELPDPSQIEYLEEPWAKIEIFTPAEYLGKVIDLVTKRRGVQKNLEYASSSRVLMVFEIPLANLIVDFYDKLKSVTAGFASLNYEFTDWRRANLVKLDILVAGERIEAFSAIVFTDAAESYGRQILEKLKTLIPRHQFVIALQAAIGGKIVARETVSAYRKDVTAKLYGGDDTRKKKLLEKQKKGKKRLKQFGRVSIPQQTFIEVLKR
ncbi:MAG: elongation factor 4 [Candidatus Doudnabacteria bacterium]|nr:elongation factor 4 [Candidatus Doudnabacteria bacterium]